jgi:hypothetical protein
LERGFGLEKRAQPSGARLHPSRLPHTAQIAKLNQKLGITGKSVGKSVIVVLILREIVRA